MRLSSQAPHSTGSAPITARLGDRTRTALLDELVPGEVATCPGCGHDPRVARADCRCVACCAKKNAGALAGLGVFQSAAKKASFLVALFTWAAAAIAAGFLTVSPVSGELEGQTRPDIVVFLTDDQTFYQTTEIPRISALIGDQGARFERAFVTTPLCCPSRSTFLSGLYAHDHGVLDNTPPDGGAPAFDDSKTLATVLQAAGYRTALIGKYLNHYCKDVPATYVPPGWSRWWVLCGQAKYGGEVSDDGILISYPREAGYSTDLATDRAVQFVHQAPAGQPLFLLYAPVVPHAPYIVAKPDRGKLPQTAGICIRANTNEADVSDKPAWIQASPIVSVATIQANCQAAHEMLRSADRGVDQIVTALAEAGRLDNAVLVFWSDNGFGYGAHRIQAKSCPYEECVRVPLWLRAPGVAPHVDAEHLVTNADLTATLADYAGVSMGKVNGHDPAGISLRGIAQDQAAPWKPAVLLEFTPIYNKGDAPNWEAIRTDRWKYVEIKTGERELYDLDTDPFELENRADDPGLANVQAQMAAQLHALRTGAS